MFFQNIHHGPEFDLLQNTVTSNMTSNTMKNLVDSSSVPNNQSDNQTLCRTTAMVERNDPSGTNYSNTFEDSKHLLPTSATIPVQNQPALYNLQKESAKYFTYDGQHRKFYLMARYLRSVQRQRRHKRRVRKRLQEQARAELKRLENEKLRVRKRLQEQARAELKRKENEKLYGTLLKHKDNPKMEVKRRTAHRINSFDSVSNDKVSTGSTILSESETEYVSGDGTIRLLCWKDIDIDLEVRSLDEENNETQTLKSTENIKLDNPEEGDTSTVIVNTNVCDIKSHLDRTYSAKDSMHRIKRRKIHCKTPNSKSFSNFKQVAQNELSSTLSCKTSTNDTLDHTGMSSRNAFLGSNLQSPKKPTKNQPHPQQFQYSTIPLVPESYGLQSDAFQKLLQSTVISNPYATCETASHDIKPEQLGRSRLSLASSRGDLDSEVVVQLSYYSQRGSVQSEEDLSFFSYRDGFVADEDVSKVTVPISLSLVIMTTYILIGAIVFSIWQDPDYLKWSYFCFITLSTIGFGDIVPGE
ncbi:unnamed protein product [Trichobilharzia regenti]|nr:unnamed protein product [Trichobilharzia regenti]